MRCAILGFVAGAAWLQMQAFLPGGYLMALLVAGAGLLAWGLRRGSGLAASAPCRIGMLTASGALLGFAWAALLAHHYLQQALPGEWEGRDITVVGTIDSLPVSFERGIGFNFAVEQVISEQDEVPDVPSRLALSWYADLRGDAAGSMTRLRPGERWQLTVRLRRPHGYANPHGFDYEVWLLEQRLRATGSVQPDRELTLKNQMLAQFVPGFSNMVQRSRYWLRERIMHALPDKDYAGVIVALVVGDQRTVSQSDWTVFNRTGIGHLVSISGLHITMVAGLFAGLFQALWRRSFFTRAQLPLLLPAQKAAAIAGVAIALVYVLLAGFGVPAQRTLYMLSVVAIALWLDRLTSVSHILCLALGLVVLLDPWAVLWSGFWLSFGAVAILLYTGTGRAGSMAHAAQSLPATWLASLRAASATQYAVTLGLVPFTMLLFGQVSLVSPLANAVAIPLISFIVTPLSLLGSVLPAPVSGWLLHGAHGCMAWLAGLLAWLSSLPLAVWSAPVPDGWIFGAALAGTLWILAPRGWPLRWLGGIGWLPLLLNLPAMPAPGQMWVTAFDVGQGNALLIETPSRRLLYDTGPSYSPESDGGSRLILPYLKARGIDRLDGMIVSHGDDDHAGGALSILAAVQVDWVSSSIAPTSPIALAARDYRHCAAGQSWRWDGIRFDMLHPAADSYDSEHLKPNARSCTLKITNGRHAILLPGDIGSAEEAELVEKQSDRLQASVLVAPHHGSATSSSEPFLDSVQPELALFQVGYRNRYRHPRQEIVDRYGKRGIGRLRSDEAGAITLQFGSTLAYSAYRADHARYWYGR